MIKNIAKHFGKITQHKWIVFKLCIKAGIPWRGLVHDLSKYSHEEFFESARYYQGDHSPIAESKKENGYSKAWLHHKGRNKHHLEYWYDYRAKIPMPMMPYVYVVEMICDTLAAGIVYNGKNWNNSTQLEYWNKELKRDEETKYINPKIKELLMQVYTQVANQGIDKTLKRGNLKEIYRKYDIHNH